MQKSIMDVKSSLVFSAHCAEGVVVMISKNGKEVTAIASQ